MSTFYKSEGVLELSGISKIKEVLESLIYICIKDVFEKKGSFTFKVSEKSLNFHWCYNSKSID